jgi:hypothetical protein
MKRFAAIALTVFLLVLASTSLFTTHGQPYNLVALLAGSNLIGKVGIDQTTPGTTNAVQATNLPSTVPISSAANLPASTGNVTNQNLLLTAHPALTWQSSNPGTSTQATTTFAAPGAGKSWVIDCLQYDVIAVQGTTVTASTIAFSIADGVPNTYFGRNVSIPAVASCTSAANCGVGIDQPIVCGLGLVGVQNQAVTIKFASGIVNTQESVNVGAFIVQ